MKPEKEIHLKEKQIVQAIVDITDLPSFLQEHLLSCAECHRKKSEFEQEIEDLGQTGAAYVPLTKQRISLALENNRHQGRWFARWRVPLGIATTVLFSLFLMWESNLIQLFPAKQENQFSMERQKTETLIMEVNMLAENALPQVYMELSTGIEKESDFENLFIEYIIPLTEEDSLSLKSSRKGVTPC